MARETTVTNVILLESAKMLLAVAENSFASRIRSAFYCERESFQDTIEQEAKQATIEARNAFVNSKDTPSTPEELKAIEIKPVEYYTALLFDSILNARFEYAEAKAERNISSALRVVMATNGGDRQKATEYLLGLAK